MSQSEAPAAVSPAIPRLTHDELLARLRDRSVVLVDALAPESYAGGHIPGASSLPLADVPGRAAIVLPDRNAAVVVYCSAFT